MTVVVIGQFCSEGDLYCGMDVYSQEGVLIGQISRVDIGEFHCAVGGDITYQRVIKAKGVTVVRAVEHSYCQLPVSAETFFETVTENNVPSGTTPERASDL